MAAEGRAERAAPRGAPEEAPAVVIGAGPAGLAAAACLKREGVEPVVLEKSDAVGSSWRGHYERLHLHTAKRWSSLPGLPFPDDAPTYVPRRQVISYLERYAERFAVRPRFGQSVDAARFRDGRWEVQANGARLVTPHLIVATSYNHEPRIPSWPGQERFEGEVIHSARYRHGAPYRGKDVLVVGIGNSGGEIAIDLHEHGARVCIAVRSPVHVVPRDSLGVPAQAFALALSRLPVPVADRIALAIGRVVVGDLSHLGLRRPAVGPVTEVTTRGRIPLIDVGTIELIRRGDVLVVPGIERFTERGVVFQNGAERRFDAVILATGFRARLDRLLEGADALTDARGYPRVHGREVRDGVTGLYFLGFRNPITGALREIAIESARIARHIAAQRTR